MIYLINLLDHYGNCKNKNVLTQLAKNVLIPLGLKATMAVTDAFIQKHSDQILWQNQQQKDLELQH